jgi:lipoprotein NlpI
MNLTDEALADLNQAIENDPEYALAYFMRGMLYIDQGNQEQAEADLEKALQLNPELGKAVEKIYNELQEQGKFEEGNLLTLQTYNHPDEVFTLNYPQGWEAVAQEGIVMFGGPESQTTGQMILVMFGATEEIFEGVEAPTLSETAEEMAAAFWENVADYEIVDAEQISEERAYLSTIATDQSFIVDIYADQIEDVAFVLMLTSMPDSDFHQTWDAIIESYMVNPDMISE